MRFRDRSEAGRYLAGKLKHYARGKNAIVLGLPRGGVPVAAEVARALELPMDAFIVRKLGVPGHEELAMGALAAGGIKVLNEDLVRQLGIPTPAIERAVAVQAKEIERRDAVYRDHQPHPDLNGRTVIIVDDGLATGATMRAAILALRKRGAARIVAAAPVGAPDSCAALRDVADEVVCA